jgi:hypothetical protein
MELSQTQKRAIKSIAGILLSLVLFFSSGVRLPYIDSAADTYFKDSITKAGASYGISRVINATVSVIQESSIGLEPAGIGVSLAVGQIADPINDMVERLSHVLVMAIASLGVQELAYEISITLVPQFAAVLLALLSLLIWLDSERIDRFQRVLLSVLVIVAIARFCLPVSSLANELLQQTFFEEKIIEANETLTASTAELDALEVATGPHLDGFMGTIGNTAVFIKEKSVDLKNVIQVIAKNKDAIIENLLRLTFLYLGIFVIQVLVLPLLVFWFLLRVANSLLLTTTLATMPRPRAPELPRVSDPPVS